MTFLGRLKKDLFLVMTKIKELQKKHNRLPKFNHSIINHSKRNVVQSMSFIQNQILNKSIASSEKLVSEVKIKSIQDEVPLHSVQFNNQLTVTCSCKSVGHLYICKTGTICII